MRVRGIDSVVFSIGLSAMASVLLAMGLNLTQVIAGRGALLASLIVTVVVPSTIALVGRAKLVTWQKILPRYWLICYLVALLLIVVGIILRVWHHALHP
jgi:hypothetical protein